MVAKRNKVIITCAVTGAIHTPTMSPHLPITPDAIAEEAIAAADAGAAILHLHARNPETGQPTPDPDVFMQFLPRIKERTDAVINITTGGGHGMKLEERVAGAMRTQPEMCSLNMGSINFGLFPLLERYENFQHEWEPQYLGMTKDFIFKNTYEDIETVLKTIGDGFGTRFEFECYDMAHLYNLAWFAEKGLVKPPFFIQTIFGIFGGIGPDIENLVHMKRIADSLFGEDYHWSILAAGRHQMGFGTVGSVMGSHVRVGLEDSLYIGKGEMATSNAEQVSKIRRILGELSMETASPAEARDMLKLKGAGNVGF